MLSILFIAWLTSGADQIVLDKTEIYSPINVKTAARRADGAFFVFDRFEHNIWLFNKGTNTRRVVARKGSGPGELERTNRIFYFENHLYALSADKIQVFDMEGVFKELHRLPPGLTIEKTQTGWVGHKQRIGGAKHELAFYSDALKKTGPIVSWSEGGSRMNRIQPDQPLKIPVFPELGNFKVSADGRLLYYRLPDQGTIHIVSTENGEKLSSISLEKRYPFDEARGQAVVDKLQAGLSGRRVKGIFPKTFPYSNGFHWDPHGYFMVAQWQGKELALLRFQPKGEPVEKARLTVDQYERIIAYDMGSYYVSFQDPVREDMGIYKLKETELEGFFQRFPMEE